MNENTEIVVVTEKQQIIDQIVVAVLSGVAGVMTSRLVEKGYRSAITSYRLKKNPA